MSKSVIIGAVVGGVAVAGAGGGAAYYMQNSGPSAVELQLAADQAERERIAREEELHYANVVSLVRRPDGRGGSMPVVVTFNLAGSNGMSAFCANVPAVEEAVLRSLSRDGLNGPVREAVNRVLAGKPVRGASVRPLTDANAGGAAVGDTQSKCRKVMKG